MRCDQCGLDLPEEDFSSPDMMLCRDCNVKIQLKNLSKKSMATNLIDTSGIESDLPLRINNFEQLSEDALNYALFEKNYEVLGLTPKAAIDEVRERCKELVKQWHPDLHKHDPDKYKQATNKMQEIKAAYEAINSYSSRAIRTSPPTNNKALNQDTPRQATVPSDSHKYVSSPPPNGARGAQMGTQEEKGKKWALNFFWFVLSIQGVRLVFGFFKNDSGEQIASAIACIVGFTVIGCPIAYLIGKFSTK